MNNIQHQRLFDSFLGKPQHPHGAGKLKSIEAQRKPAPLDWLDQPLDLRETHRIASEEIDYAISPIFPAGRAALITGVGASSKTTLLKLLAIAITTGRSVLGFSIPKTGKVVLVLAEDTAEDAYRSLDAIFQSMNLSAEEIELVYKRLFIFAAAGKDCVIVSNANSEEDLASKRLEKLIHFIKSLGDVRLVGLDPAIALSRGRELDEQAQHDFAKTVNNIAMDTKAAVLVISHAAKSVQYQQEVVSHASRGSGAITDAFRLEVLMRVMTSKEAKSFQINDAQRHRYVRMQVTKANALPPELMQPAWLERVTGGTLKLVNIAPAAETRPRSALELFFEIDQETGELCPIPLSYSGWREKASKAGLLTGSNQSAQNMSATRLFDVLKKSLWITEIGGDWRPTDEGVKSHLG
jgi:ABC-type thiamine transport system ATPase subunit